MVTRTGPKHQSVSVFIKFSKCCRILENKHRFKIQVSNTIYRDPTIKGIHASTKINGRAKYEQNPLNIAGYRAVMRAGWTGGQTDGQTSAQMEWQMDGQTDSTLFFSSCFIILSSNTIHFRMPWARIRFLLRRYSTEAYYEGLVSHKQYFAVI